MTLVRFLISALYVLFGLSGFVAFIILENYHACVFSILTAIINIVLSHLHFLNFKERLLIWYTLEIIRSIGRFGFLMFLISTVSLVYYTALEIMLKQPIMPIEESLIIPIVWTFIASKSGLVLLYYGRVYSRSNEDLLLREEES